MNNFEIDGCIASKASNRSDGAFLVTGLISKQDKSAFIMIASLPTIIWRGSNGILPIKYDHFFHIHF